MMLEQVNRACRRPDRVVVHLDAFILAFPMSICSNNDCLPDDLVAHQLQIPEEDALLPEDRG